MKKATLLAGLFAFVLAISVSAQEPVKTDKKEVKKECCTDKKKAECKDKKAECCSADKKCDKKQSCCSEKKATEVKAPAKK